MDTSQWTEGNIGVINNSMEGSNTKPAILEKRARPQKDQALNCPRCNSTNTKFCYYNNYSLSQPRYFCKSCRRYWTEGGSLRNVPVGGGSRKNRRSIISSSSSTTKKLPDHLTSPNFSQSTNTDQNPKIHQGQDLNLAYPPAEDYNNNLSKFIEAPYSSTENPSSNSAAASQLSAMELLKSGITASSSRGLNSFIPLSVSNSGTMYNSTGFTLQDFRPADFRFSSANGYGGLEGIEEGSGGARILFPAEDLKQIPISKHEFEQNRSLGDSTGYWNGMQGGESW